MNKRLLSALLALVMVLSMLPVTVLAAGTEEVIADATATFPTKVAAFNGESVLFTPDSNGEATVEISACNPGYYVDVWADGEWLTEFIGSAAQTVSFDVTGGVEYELIICTCTVYSPSMYDHAAGSISYKVTVVTTGEVDQPEEPTDPVDPSLIPGATPENPKLLTTADWVFFEAGQTVWYLYDNYQNMMENGVYSMMLHVHAAVDYSVSYRGMDVPVDADGFVNYEMLDVTYQGQYLFCVTNNATEKAFFSVEVKERPQYVNTGIALRLGRNNITLDTSAVFTLYEFTPTTTGVYSIVAAEGVVGDWGVPSNPKDNTENKTNTLTWTCTAVGQSLLVGFTGAETTVATVTRTGDYIPPEEIPWTVYENTYDFSYEVPGDAEIVDVDLTDGFYHTAVIGEDGFYHYGNAEGPLLVVNFSTVEINIQDAYTNGGLRAWLIDENKQTISKVDYNEALFAYYKAGTVPVTPELAVMFTELGAANGWWQAGGLIFTETAPEDLSMAWLQLCGYVVPTGVTVKGNVTASGDGEASVALWQNGMAMYTAAVSEGVYEIRDVIKGTYTLTVTKPGHVTREYTLTVSAEDVEQDVKICLLGDVTGEGKINMGDVARAFAHSRKTGVITDEYILACMDMTGDGKVNLGDVARLFAAVRGK